MKQMLLKNFAKYLQPNLEMLGPMWKSMYLRKSIDLEFTITIAYAMCNVEGRLNKTNKRSHEVPHLPVMEEFLKSKDGNCHDCNFTHIQTVSCQNGEIKCIYYLNYPENSIQVHCWNHFLSLFTSLRTLLSCLEMKITINNHYCAYIYVMNINRMFYLAVIC